ncbi:hypothetical protein [Mesorhizobium sp. B2-1-3A]|uniref:hypothetical protein n=1 Tax=Mesorhizobium sp. B2-1-3A TaxID=2589971 RepID=UPI00112E9E39|nr:hypothetical protein [Mesorhizobium sp. B2-1-3A]TPM92174.1 hypothetical protein FJ977_30760 [Mesorhizobium sp. B2-1-3A]
MLTAFFCALAIVLIVGLSFAGISFRMPVANYACICVAYLAYCFLAASCLGIPLKALRIGGLFVTAMPILIGYFLGTVGRLALGWTVVQSSEPPRQMSAGVVCSITYWGSAASDSGYVVNLFKIWGWAPFLQREVFSASVDQTVDQPEMSCTDAWGTYVRGARTSLE